MTEVTRGHTASASEMDPATIKLITTFIFYFGPYLMMDIVEWRCVMVLLSEATKYGI